MSYLLGIDVGTTRTAAAIGRSGARPGDIEIVNLGDRSSAVPSVIYVGDDGSVLVGEAAERRSVTDPDHVVREFKRRIGDPTPVLVAGRPWAPEDLSAQLVRWVVDRAAQREGGPAVRVAVTHPASWGPHKKDQLGGALARQGLPVTFLAEPQAAALHYASAERVEPGSTIAVYDLGGGTFDAAVVHKDGNGFGLMGRPEGIERLGGIDFDELVFEHVREGIPEAFEDLDEADPSVLSAVAAIRRECREAKEALSSDTEVSIPVLTPAGQGSVRLHRSEFEAMIRPRVEETVDALRRAIGSAGLAPAQLSAVLLVGGSSRIPLVGQLVSEQLERPVAVDTDPKNAIAKGAALSLLPPTAGTGGGMQAHVPSGRGTSPRLPAAPPGGGPGAGVAAAGVAGALGAGALGAGAAAAQGAPPSYGPPGGAHGPGGAGPLPGGDEPPTQLVSGSGAMPPMPPPPPRMPPAFPERPHTTHPGSDHPHSDHPDEYDYPDERPTRSPALLVGAGGALAALAVVAAVFLWPSGDADADRTARITESTGGVATPVIASTSEAPPTTETDTAGEPDPALPPVTKRTTRPSTSTTTTTAPTTAPTTTEPTTTTTEPTTAPTTEPTPDVPPVSQAQ